MVILSQVLEYFGTNYNCLPSCTCSCLLPRFSESTVTTVTFQITNNFGAPCDQQNTTNFMNNCSYSAAYDLLNFIYGGNLTVCRLFVHIRYNRQYTVYIEDICFSEVTTKYISSSELKTSEFSRVRSKSENFYVFNSRDEIYLVFTKTKQIFFLFYTIHGHFPIHKAGGENAKTYFF